MANKIDQQNISDNKSSDNTEETHHRYEFLGEHGWDSIDSLVVWRMYFPDCGGYYLAFILPVIQLVNYFYFTKIKISLNC